MQRGLQHWAKLHNVIKNGEEVPPSFRQPHELAEENRIPLSPIIFPSIVRHLLIQFAQLSLDLFERFPKLVCVSVTPLQTVFVEFNVVFKKEYLFKPF